MHVHGNAEVIESVDARIRPKVAPPGFSIVHPYRLVDSRRSSYIVLDRSITSTVSRTSTWHVNDHVGDHVNVDDHVNTCVLPRGSVEELERVLPARREHEVVAEIERVLGEPGALVIPQRIDEAAVAAA